MQQMRRKRRAKKIKRKFHYCYNDNEYYKIKHCNVKIFKINDKICQKLLSKLSAHLQCSVQTRGGKLRNMRKQFYYCCNDYYKIKQCDVKLNKNICNNYICQKLLSKLTAHLKWTDQNTKISKTTKKQEQDNFLSYFSLMRI